MVLLIGDLLMNQERESVELVHYDSARIALEKAATVDEAKKIKDQVTALEVYARQRNDTAMEAWLSEIKIRAACRIGEISKGLDTGAGRPSKILLAGEKNFKSQTLKAAGLSVPTANRYEALARIKEDKEEQFERFIKKKIENRQPIKFSDVETYLVRQDKDDKRKKILYTQKEVTSDGLIVGDFKKQSDQIEDDSVELIFTDPPYERNSVELYGDAARIAARVLKPGGSLICYCGQYLVPEIVPMMQKHLRFWWINACVHADQQARMKEYGVIVGWKPMLWFTKGVRGDRQEFVSDIVSGGREKDTMGWQQAVSEAAYYIEKLTSKKGLIVDFFAGGGTTCIAAKRLGRKWIAFEKEPSMAKKADKRIADDTNV